ncbi:hypothetical protein FALBO_8532 [Fusarium albosuccineum]|uniref:Uncharacterized protein n=1 Tax=Fusarium albosuccineum TaxID=1237068 RepID=A0A8H4P6U7_9HYPO|nr:hypothetical protein FALBO_8532 [Fusarium albosuccineum]
MKAAVLSLLAGGAAAQINLGPNLLNVAAANPNDPGYASCTEAVSLVQDCVSSIGGLDAAATADPQALIGCACCDGRSNAAPIYGACSSYLEEEVPDASSQYDAYGTLYMACSAEATCNGGGSLLTSTIKANEDSSTITASPSSQTYAAACVDMLDIFTSCTKANRDFTELPFKEQAECYCCRGSGSDLTWTDEIDSAASTCANWARTGEPDTAYPVAKTFATFCQRFTDVCENAASKTEDAESTETEEASSTEEDDSRRTSDSSSGSGSDSDSDSDSGSATTSEQNNNAVTVTVQPTATEGSDGGNAAASLRVSLGAALAAVAAVALAL